VHGCRRQLGRACRRLAEAVHGSWYFAVQVPKVGGAGAGHRQGGYSTPEAAHAAGQAGQFWTVSRWRWRRRRGR
jgi:hypothetical protein